MKRRRVPFVAALLALAAAGLPACDVADPTWPQFPPAVRAPVPAATVSYGSHPSQRLVVYRSAARPARGTVVFLHGGGFATGSPGDVADISFLTRQLSRGWDVVSVGYRFTDVAPWPAQIHDARSALGYVRARAASLGVHTHRVVVAGYSAGATLASLLAVAANTPGHPAQGPPVAGFISVSGRADLSTPDRAASDLRRRLRLDAGGVAQASYLRHLDPWDPPGYLVHGDRDDTVPVLNAWAVREAVADRSRWRFDVVDRDAAGRFLPADCRGHAPVRCVNAPAVDTWLDTL